MAGAVADRFTKKRPRGRLRGVVCVWLTAGLFGAVAGTAAGRAADVELGRYLSSECMTCHGVAKASDTIPNIYGLGETHFVEVIKAYRAKALPNPVMQNIAGRLNDEEIDALAAYFATVHKPK